MTMVLNHKDYIEKAKRNRDFVNEDLYKLVKSYPDWVTVVAFYSALHFVDAYLILKHSLQFEHHTDRDKAVALLMGEIYAAYHRLYDLSFRSRYLRVEDNPSPDEAESAVKFELSRVQEFVERFVR